MKKILLTILMLSLSNYTFASEISDLKKELSDIQDKKQRLIYELNHIENIESYLISKINKIQRIERIKKLNNNKHYSEMDLEDYQKYRDRFFQNYYGKLWNDPLSPLPSLPLEKKVFENFKTIKNINKISTDKKLSYVVNIPNNHNITKEDIKVNNNILMIHINTQDKNKNKNIINYFETLPKTIEVDTININKKEKNKVIISFLKKV